MTAVLQSRNVLGNTGNGIVFDRIVEINTVTGKKIFGVYDSNKEYTINDIMKGMKKNLEYCLGNDEEHIQFWNASCDLKYARSTKLQDIQCKPPIIQLAMIWSPPFVPYKSDCPEISTELKSELEKTSNKLYVKTLTGKTIHLPYHPDLMIGNIKQMIQDKEGIPPNQQRLIYDGIQFENEHERVADTLLQPYSTLHLILTLRGGMFHETSGKDGNYRNLNNLIFTLDTNDDEALIITNG